MKRHIVGMLVAATMAGCGGSSLPSAPSQTPPASAPEPSPRPAVSISANPTITNVGETVHFTLNVTDPTNLVELSFGDGANLSLSGGRDARVVHVFRTAGTYVVTATAKDSSGHSSSAMVTITVR